METLSGSIIPIIQHPSNNHIINKVLRNHLLDKTEAIAKSLVQHRLATLGELLFE